MQLVARRLVAIVAACARGLFEHVVGKTAQRRAAVSPLMLGMAGGAIGAAQFLVKGGFVIRYGGALRRSQADILGLVAGRALLGRGAKKGAMTGKAVVLQVRMCIGQVGRR